MIVAMNATSPLRKVFPPSREVAIVVYPGVQSLDLAGPLEVFSGAQLLLDLEQDDARCGYHVSVISRDGAPLETSSGLTIVPGAGLGDAPGDIDTLIVAGGYGCVEATEDTALIDWVRQASTRARRTAPVCTG